MRHLHNFKWVIILIISAFSTFAANFPLEIINIRALGTGTMPFSSNNRICKAYPGITYNIGVAVIGGNLPYKYYLTTKPNGMSIDSLTGEITWINPQVGASATVRVVDSDLTEVTASWNINVNTKDFIFIDSSAASSGTGTINSPFKRMMDMMGANKSDGTHSGKIVYFRKGTYDLEGYYDNINDPTQITFYNKPIGWIAYPGEKVILDFKKQNIAASYLNQYFEGLEIKNCANYGIQSANGYNTFRNLYFHGLTDIIGGNNNQSFLRFGSGYSTVITGCTFDTTIKCGIKLYLTTKCLIENNILRNNSSTEGFAVKMSCDSIFIRKNTINGSPSLRGITIDAYLGNGQGCRNIEILQNKIVDCPSAMVLGSNGALGKTIISDNVIEGVPSLRNVSTSEGPVFFNDNVIENTKSDAGQITSSSYYREGIYFEASPNTFNTNVLTSKATSIKINNNGTHTPFLSKTILKTENNCARYDVLGKKIQLTKTSSLKAVIHNEKPAATIKLIR